MLGQDVQRRLRDLNPVEVSRPDSPNHRHAFQQLIAGEREEPPLGKRAEGVSAASDPLQEVGDGAIGTDLANEIDVADVDSHFQRCRGHDRLQLSIL